MVDICVAVVVDMIFADIKMVSALNKKYKCIYLFNWKCKYDFKLYIYNVLALKHLVMNS